MLRRSQANGKARNQRVLAGRDAEDVLDEADKVIYTEQVPEIGSEPNYERAIEALTGR